MRHLTSTILLAGTLIGCAAGTQQARPQVAQADCAGLINDASVTRLYGPGKVKKVEPIYRQVFVARAIQPRYVAGARMYVPAEPGMNEAYVERVLSCHAATSRGQHVNDPLGADGVTDVDVKTVGPMVRIAVIGEDRAAGKAIFERARALHEGRGDVSVEQLSAGPRQTTPL